MLYTLILDTSTERAQIVLAIGKEVLFSFELPFGLESSKFLMPSLKNAFEKFTIGPADLKAVAVACGPGSFTGIRVGASLAKGICLSRNIPLISLCSLEGLIHPKDG